MLEYRFSCRASKNSINSHGMVCAVLCCAVLMKVAIYFSEKLILFLFRPPHPLTPSRKGRGDFHSLNPFSQGGREFGHLLPLPLREGVGGWGGLMKIAIYFTEKLILFCSAYAMRSENGINLKPVFG
jgi:hypothetical protein